MKIIGFQFNKILCEKKGGNLKDVKLNTNIDLSSIDEVKSEMIKTKEQIISVKFNYLINYAPQFAKIELSGEIVMVEDEKIAKEILKDWKDKKLPPQFKMGLFNLILKKSSIKALQLEEEMGLPYHIPFPSLKASEDDSKSKKE